MGAVTKVAVTNSWALAATTFTAVSMVQCTAAGAAVIELISAATTATPASTDEGIRMANMDTLGSVALADLGAAGGLFVRKISGNNVNLLVL
jgi:hypothetical protein